MYCCPHCQRSYQRKNYFDRHVGVCNILCQSKQKQKIETEERLDTPTLRQLYTIVMELAMKNKQLEEKVREMSTWTNIKQQKINTIDWLNMTYSKADDYTDWIRNIQVTQVHLKKLFDSNYANGVMSTFKEMLPLTGDDDNNRPLRAFNTKNNVFYIYNQADKKWIEMDNETYLKLMYILDKKMVVEFGKWQRANKDKMYSDDFSETYTNYTKKVMATRELMYSRVKKELYNYLRQPITF
jgi:hypothetical protein